MCNSHTTFLMISEHWFRSSNLNYVSQLYIPLSLVIKHCIRNFRGTLKRLYHLYILIYFGRSCTVYPEKYAHGFCFAVLCCGYTLTDFLISIRLTSLALWQSNDFPSASKATLMNMDKYFVWIHYERLHNHNKAKHNKTVCIFLGIYCMVPDVARKFRIGFLFSLASTAVCGIGSYVGIHLSR